MISIYKCIFDILSIWPLVSATGTTVGYRSRTIHGSLTRNLATLWPDGGSEKGMQHSRGQLDRNTLARGEEQRAGQDIVGPRDIKKATKTADWAIRLPQTSNLEARLIWFFIIIKFWSSWSEFWYLIYKCIYQWNDKKYSRLNSWKKDANYW